MLGFPLPVIIFLCLFIGGIIKYVIDSRSDSDEGLETDNIQSVGTILGNLMIFVNNIVLGSSYCLVRAMTSLKKLKKIGTINNQISSKLLSQIQSKTKDKRYHNMSDFKEFAPHIEDLIYHDIIWERAQGGVMQIALNRKYDNVKVA